MDSLANKRVVVMGLGRFGGGVGVTRWLCEQGAAVVVTDLAKADDLASSIAQLDGLPVEYRLGGHDAVELDRADVLIANPAVAFDAPLLVAARKRGLTVTTEINLFLSHCPAPVAGVTGSVGKSTTCALAAEAIATARPTHLGGNIGRSLLTELGRIEADHAVVLELSSFQLAYLPTIARSPEVALVTNLLANHLDRHGTMDHYAACKRNLFRYQRSGDVLIVNADDPATRGWAEDAPGRVEQFRLDDQPFELAIPGLHNQVNAQAAWAVARQFGASRPAAAKAFAQFTGLPDRLQRVAERDGVRFYNDSKATTPEGAVVALDAFAPRTAVAIVGGYDKHAPLADFGRALAERCAAVVCTGQTGPAVAEQVRRAGFEGPIVEAAGFDQAVAAAAALAQPGQVVLLSPGFASYDQFSNYQQRGRRFVELVAGP